MINQSEILLSRLYEISRLDIPSNVTQKARECLLDYIGVTYAACSQYESINIQYVKDNNYYGAFHVIGTEIKSDIHTAVIMNAFNAHVLELDDSHRVAMTHLGAPIISALIGVAELKDSNIDSLIRGIVVGYEAAIRVAMVIQPSHKKRGFHVSGTCCTIGAAMGIASMLNYSYSEMKNVLSAATTSAAGLLEVIGGKSEQKPYNVANAAISGVNAALYGKLFEGAADILAGSRGFYRAVSDRYDPQKIYGDDYAILGIYQKIYASCRHCHAPVEAVLYIKNNDEIHIDNIECIDVQTYSLALAGHDHTMIEGVSSAKQSIPFAVAAACCLGTGGLEAFNDTAVSDEDILALTKKVHLRKSPELTALVPDIRAAIVTIKYKDGTEASKRIDYAKGEPENPITKEELIDKYRLLMANAFVKQEEAYFICNQVLNNHDCKVRDLFKREDFLS